MSHDRLLEDTYRAEQRHFWFRGFRRFVRPLLVEASEGRPTLRLLDCGCGTGRNLEMLDAFGRAFGFDLTWTGLRFAGRSGRSRVAQATATHIPCGDERFDLVTSFDMLQCLDDRAERAALAEMYRVLRPAGALIVNVAALNALRGQHAVVGGEVRRYTRHRLRAVIERAGFQIARLTYTNATLFPLMLGVRVLQRWKGLATDVGPDWEMGIPPAPVNALLAAALGVEARALAWIDMPIGTSVLCLAKKPPHVSPES